MRRMFLVVFALAAVLVPAALATTPAQAAFGVLQDERDDTDRRRQDVQEHG